MVHQIDHVTMRDYINGIKTDSYEFYDEYPHCKEVLVMGAANSGKSTLINALNGAYQGLGSEEMAYVSKNKGKTYQLNFYLVRNRHGLKKRQGMLVDSPGYGRTQAPTKLKEKWYKMLTKYLCFGVRINMVLLCIAAHRGVQGHDWKVLEDLSHIGKTVHIVLTKVDKVKDNETLLQTMAETRQVITKYPNIVRPEIHLVAAKDHFGIPDLRSRIGIAFELHNYGKPQ